MRLVACQHCHAQYDVTNVSEKVFTCRCGSEVANLEEYAALLARLRPGTEVEIVVLRAGRRVSTRATPGRR